MNGNDATQIKDGETNDANARYEANIDVQGVKDEGDAEETIGEDIDLSLLHEDDDAADSDLERSNDDAEAIKLLNEDDDAFESFLEGEGSSSDNLIGNSGENTAIENNYELPETSAVKTRNNKRKRTASGDKLIVRIRNRKEKMAAAAAVLQEMESDEIKTEPV